MKDSHHFQTSAGRHSLLFNVLCIIYYEGQMRPISEHVGNRVIYHEKSLPVGIFLKKYTAVLEKYS